MKHLLCACGCGRPTAGGKYLPGHGVKAGRHWAKLSTPEEKAHITRKSLQQRIKVAYTVYANKGPYNANFCEPYFALYDAVYSWVREHRTEQYHVKMEEIVEFRGMRGFDLQGTPQGEWPVTHDSRFYQLDITIPELLLDFEYSPGHRVATGTVDARQREQDLKHIGWQVLHVRTVPDFDAIRATVEFAEASIRHRKALHYPTPTV